MKDDALLSNDKRKPAPRKCEAPAGCENLLDALVEHSTDSILRHDRSLRCVYANTTFLASSGLSLHALAKPLAPDSLLAAAGYQAALEAALASGESQSTELSWRDHHGHDLHSHVRFIPEHAVTGETESVLVVARDITEQHDVDRLDLQPFQSLGPAARGHGLVPEGGQDLLHDAQVHRVVVDVQDLEGPAAQARVVRHGLAPTGAIWKNLNYRRM